MTIKNESNEILPEMGWNFEPTKYKDIVQLNICYIRLVIEPRLQIKKKSNDVAFRNGMNFRPNRV